MDEFTFGHDHARRDELIGALLGGDIDDAGQRELDALVAGDRQMIAEIADLRALSETLRQSGVAATPVAASSTLDERVAAIATDASVTSIADARERRSWFRPAALAVAASLLVIGAVGGGLLQSARGGLPAGDPGTLGALEKVTFTDVPSSASVEGNLIAHTWGTETDMTITGLAKGETFDVVLIDDQGRDLEAGSFLGASATVTCRMNAAVLRQDVSSVQIRSADGEVVALADVPAVDS